LSQAPNNIICNESSIKTKDMGRGEKPAFIQNTERDRVQQAIQDTEREISACHIKYKQRQI
jgi:hypothetical protein